MTKQQYSILAEKHSPEELADSFMFPARLTKKQKAEADAALSETLKQRRAAMSAEDRLKGALLQLRFANSK